MLLEQPPVLFRKSIPGGIFRLKEGDRRRVYLTFDDGPIPEVTPMVLDILDRYDAKATFFMVGDNVRKYPALYEEVVRRGHDVGNHTMHHLKSLNVGQTGYIEDVEEAARLIDSRLFRPPHGWLKRSHRLALERNGYRIVMFDVVTRDYSKRITAEQVISNIKRYTRPGSIIVFHDSLKSKPKLMKSLSESLEWLKSEGYEFGLIWEKIKKGY